MSYTVLDCFCGAGVGALGAEWAGLETVFAFDNNKHAVRNFNKNIANVAHIIDMKTVEFDDLPDTDIITGGFPCKPWSEAGNRKGQECEKNGNLAKRLIDLILHKQPKAFLIENVKGIVNKHNKPYFDKLIEELEEVYAVTWKVIDCSDYGVPQKRERVFVVGIRKDLNKVFEFPIPTHSENKVSIRQAIGDLPEHPDGINNHEYNEKWTLRNDEKPFVHKIGEGECWKALPKEDQKAFMKGALNTSGGKTTYLSVMKWDEPSRTIMSSPMGKNSSQILRLADGSSRRYTVRESLRLQGVPDSFGFDEETPIRMQYERCSGIPPIISEMILSEVKNLLNNC